MTERHLRGDPPSPDEFAAAVADIDSALQTVRETVPVDSARTLVGLAGSVTTVAGMALELPQYEPEKIHLSRITADRVHSITRRLMHATRADRAAVPVMHPGRVDVIAAGALILDRVMREFGFGAVVVSEHDILDGIAWSLV
jgi:exopolyphosphatase / guanosine-5'-triphosphate,3'-diphosphate pyrophosphatase